MDPNRSASIAFSIYDTTTRLVVKGTQQASSLELLDAAVRKRGDSFAWLFGHYPVGTEVTDALIAESEASVSGPQV